MNYRIGCFLLWSSTFSLASVAQNTNPADNVVVQSDSSDLKIFEKVDIEATFPGGDVAWKKYLEQNLHGDVAVENGAPAGRYTVWIQFVVDKAGAITNVTALSHNGYGMEQEVVRLIKKGPQWQPASQDGRMVKAYRKQPVTFLIENDGIQITTQEPYTLFQGIDNPVTITVDKVSPANLTVTISMGSIIAMGNGNYNIRVNRPGRVVLHMFNKKNKEIGAASFEVKPRDQSSTAPNTSKG